jgi:hypothetical protein
MPKKQIMSVANVTATATVDLDLTCMMFTHLNDIRRPKMLGPVDIVQKGRET